MPTFEDLNIWQEAHSLMKEIHQLCQRLPKEEKFRLRGQIEDSSLSVCDNIAEGYTAYYYNDKIKGMYTARKEAGETQNHLRSLEKGMLVSLTQTIRFSVTKKSLRVSMVLSATS